MEEEHKPAPRPPGYFVEQLLHSGMWVAGYERGADNCWNDHAYIGRSPSTGEFGFYNNPFVPWVEMRFSTRRGAEKFLKEYRIRKGDGDNRERHYDVNPEARPQVGTASVEPSRKEGLVARFAYWLLDKVV